MELDHMTATDQSMLEWLLLTFNNYTYKQVNKKNKQEPLCVSSHLGIKVLLWYKHYTMLAYYLSFITKSPQPVHQDIIDQNFLLHLDCMIRNTLYLAWTNHDPRLSLLCLSCHWRRQGRESLGSRLACITHPTKYSLNFLQKSICQFQLKNMLIYHYKACS